MTQQTKNIQKNKTVEEIRAEDGTLYLKNLDTDKPYTWLYKVRKGRYSATIVRKKTIRTVSAQDRESGFFQEQEQESVFLVLEQGVKKGDKWENIRMQMSMMDARVLQFVFDGIETVQKMFKGGSQ